MVLMLLMVTSDMMASSLTCSQSAFHRMPYMDWNAGAWVSKNHKNGSSLSIMSLLPCDATQWACTSKREIAMSKEKRKICCDSLMKGEIISLWVWFCFSYLVLCAETWTQRKINTKPSVYSGNLVHTENILKILILVNLKNSRQVGDFCEKNSEENREN